MANDTDTLTRQVGATERRLLQALARHGPQSRAQLARRLDVMRSTIGTQVSKLLDAQLLREAPHQTHNTPQAKSPNRSGAGRPGSAIEFNPKHRSFIGVDLGIGYVRAALVDLAGTVLAHRAQIVPSDQQTPERMSRMIAQILASLKAQATSLEGAMISVPGQVNTSGTILRLPLIDWRDVEFRALLDHKLPDFGPISIDNDARIFAKGELLSPEEHGSSAIYFWMDAGIGAGIVVNDALMTGANGLAGEVGHTFVGRATGKMGSRLDDKAGLPALFEQAHSAGLHIETIADLAHLIDQGDPDALTILSDWTSVISETCSSLASIFDPNTMIFSGPLASLLQRGLPQIHAKTEELLFHGTVMPSLVLREHAHLQLALSCVTVLRDAYLKGDTRSRPQQTAAPPQLA